MENNPWTKEEMEFVATHVDSMTDTQIGQYLNRSATSVQSYRSKHHMLKKNPYHSKYTYNDVVYQMNKCGYELLSTSNEFKNASSKMRYICPKHRDKGAQQINIGHLIQGEGCMYCGCERTIAGERMDDLSVYNDEAKELCRKCEFEFVRMGRDNKGYVSVYYICTHHREAGVQHMRIYNMRRSNIIGCPYCVDKKKFKFSHGEKAIKQFFDDHNINYIQEYRFNDCRETTTLPFDFYLPNKNTVVEYDGEHHYHPVQFNGISEAAAQKDFNDIQRHDKIKNQYCADNDIKLIRIPYWDKSNINDILSENLLHKLTA